MHEMGIVLRIVQTAAAFAEENRIDNVRTLTVQIGEASGALPRYVESFFTEVVKDYPALKDCKIHTELVPAKLFCFECGTTWIPEDDEKSEKDHEHEVVRCPECGSEKYRFIEGRNVIIKEMEV